VYRREYEPLLTPSHLLRSAQFFSLFESNRLNLEEIGTTCAALFIEVLKIENLMNDCFVSVIDESNSNSNSNKNKNFILPPILTLRNFSIKGLNTCWDIILTCKNEKVEVMMIGSLVDKIFMPTGERAREMKMPPSILTRPAQKKLSPARTPAPSRRSSFSSA